MIKKYIFRIRYRLKTLRLCGYIDMLMCCPLRLNYIYIHVYQSCSILNSTWYIYSEVHWEAIHSAISNWLPILMFIVLLQLENNFIDLVKVPTEEKHMRIYNKKWYCIHKFRFFKYNNLYSLDNATDIGSVIVQIIRYSSLGGADDSTVISNEKPCHYLSFSFKV